MGYRPGQINGLGRPPLDCDKAPDDLYGIWKSRLKKLLREEMIPRNSIH